MTIPLLATGPTVNGAAYEEIVGANIRGEKGEFFTPRVVVEAAIAMLQLTPDDLCCDPACGSGGFSVLMMLGGSKAISERYSKRSGKSNPGTPIGAWVVYADIKYGDQTKYVNTTKISHRSPK